MIIYLLLFALLCICWITLYQNPGDDIIKREKKYCIFIALVFILIAALRGENVGTDTDGYYRDYTSLGLVSFEQILKSQAENPGYYVLAKVMYDAGVSVQLWFGIVATLYVGSVSKLIFRFSKNITLSYIMFLTLGFYSFSLSGLKQTIAMAILLYAFNFLYDKKYIRFFICLAVSTYFHASSWSFIFAFILAIMKQKRYIYMLLSCAFAIVIFNAKSILGSAVDLLGNEHYGKYLEYDKKYSPTTFVVFLVILLFAFVYLKNYAKENRKECTMMCGMTYLGVIALLFSFVVASAFRLALYFTVFSIILVPNVLTYEKNIRIRELLNIVISLVCVLYFIYVNREGGSIVPYEFYWNETGAY